MSLDKTIIISSDHNGLKLKNKIQKKFSNKFNFIDLGPSSKEKVDYSDYPVLFQKTKLSMEY